MSPRPDPRAARMVAVLGHELRNPLAAGIAGVAAAAEMTDAADPRRVFLDRSLQDLARIARLLDRYLEYGSRRALQVAATDLAAVAERAAQRHPAVVTIDAPGAVVVRCDETLLERCLENIVDNAVQAGAAHVAVEIRTRGQQAVVDIVDDGPGIPESFRDKIFEPFFSGRDGTGIGLALVADVVQAHGGAIAVLPTPRGARLQLTLPTQVRRDAEPRGALALAQAGTPTTE